MRGLVVGLKSADLLSIARRRAAVKPKNLTLHFESSTPGSVAHRASAFVRDLKLWEMRRVSVSRETLVLPDGYWFSARGGHRGPMT
jgi:hypothetical protein